MDSYALEISNSTHLLSPDVISLLNTSLSKLSVAILKELYQSPKMQQKNLAASIHTTPNSLSNILSKMECLQPQLLITEKIGRYKYYSLTETASMYVAQVILPQTNKIHKFATLSHEDVLISETRNILYQFQETAGYEWDMILDNMLIHAQDVATSESTSFSEVDQLSVLYVDFVNHMKQLKIQNQESLIREIHDILGQPILIKRLESYLSKELEDFYILKPLFELEKQSREKAIQLIDQVFAEMDLSVLNSMPVRELCIDKILPDDQYYKVFYKLHSMKKEFANTKYRGNKQLVLKHWRTIYPTQSFSIEYIAEKCAALYVKYNSFFATSSV